MADDTPEAPEDLPSDIGAESRAAQGWQTLFQHPLVQSALDVGGNLDRYGQTVKAAMAGDPDAKLALAQQSLGTAMGTLKPVPSSAAALPMDEASRMARAQGMGYRTSPEEITSGLKSGEIGGEWFHGTNKQFEAFDPEQQGQAGRMHPESYWFTRAPQMASDFAEHAAVGDYISGRIPFDFKEDAKLGKKVESLIKKLADLGPNNHWQSHQIESQIDQIESYRIGKRYKGQNIIPAYLKTENPFIYNAGGDSLGEDQINKLINRAKAKGHDSVLFRQMVDSPSGEYQEPTDIMVVFKPNQVRSKFAEFNPKKAKSSNISAGFGAAAIGGGLGAAALGSSQDAQAQGFAEGGIAQPSRVPIVNPSGLIGTINADEAEDAIKSGGFRYPSTKELADFQAQQKYGPGAGNLLGAFAAGAARAGTFGLSDLAMTKSGMISPETLAGLQAAHPVASTAGEIGGIAASLALPGVGEAAAARGVGAAERATAIAERPFQISELANPVKAVSRLGEKGAATITGALGIPEEKAGATLANKIISRVGSAGFGSAIEGAIYSGGQDITEYSLGDPHLNGEKALATAFQNVALGGLLGGGVGAALGLGSIPAEGIAKIVGKGTDWAHSKIFPEGVRDAVQKDTLATNAARAVSVPAVPTGPESFEELASVLRRSPYAGLKAELPAKQTLIDAVNRLAPDMEHKPLAPEYEALSDQHAFDFWRSLKEDPASEEGRVIQNYNAIQKHEATQKLQSVIRGLAPGKELVSDPVKAGQLIVDSFTNQYQAEKEALAPFFKRFDAAAIHPATDAQEIVNSLSDAIPGIENYLKLSPEGFEIAKYAPTMPMTRTVYGAIKDVIDAVNEKEVTLGGIRNVRENLRGFVDWMSNPKDSAQISSLRKSLMDYVEGQVQKIDPDLAVRDIFRRYAVNEANRDVIERLLGGSISDKASFAKTIKPEDVSDRIFANTVAVKSAASLLGNDFNHAVGNYLQTAVANVSDPARMGFSSNKFQSFLKRKGPELEAALSNQPEALQKIRDWTSVMRILPDAPSVNPSGTAKTAVLQKIHAIGSVLNGGPTGAVGNLFRRWEEGIGKYKKDAMLDAMMRGQNAKAAEQLAEEKLHKYTFYGWLERTFNKTTQAIHQAADSVFSAASLGSQPFAGYAASRLISHKEKATRHQDTVALVQRLQNNPEAFLNQLETATAGLHGLTPKMTVAMQHSLAQMNSFLASKIPPAFPSLPLSPTHPPETADVLKFNRYLDAVHYPVGVMSDIREGKISPESIETLSAVYPKLYSEMQMAVMEKLNEHLADGGKIPYETKVGLGLFLGQDLVHSTTAAHVAANQQAWSTPGAAQARNDLQQRIKTSQKGLSAMHLSAQIQTPMQAAAGRTQKEA